MKYFKECEEVEAKHPAYIETTYAEAFCSKTTRGGIAPYIAGVIDGLSPKTCAFHMRQYGIISVPYGLGFTVTMPVQGGRIFVKTSQGYFIITGTGLMPLFNQFRMMRVWEVRENFKTDDPQQYSVWIDSILVVENDPNMGMPSSTFKKIHERKQEKKAKIETPDS